MPTYRYRCAKCSDELEKWQSFSDEPLVKHRGCGGKLAKVLTTPGIVLKGSGFYRTDSRNGSSKQPDSAGDRSRDSTTASDGDGSKDSGSKDSGSKDSGSKDSGSKDSGSKDSGSKDSGSKDSGPKDSGSKATPATKSTSAN